MTVWIVGGECSVDILGGCLPIMNVLILMVGTLGGYVPIMNVPRQPSLEMDALTHYCGHSGWNNALRQLSLRLDAPAH